MSRVMASDACLSIISTILTLAPAATARLAAVSRRSCGVSGWSPTREPPGRRRGDGCWSYAAECRLCGELLCRPYQPARLAHSQAQRAPVRQPYQWRLGAGFPPSDVLQLTDDSLAARHPPHGRTQRWRVDAPTNLLLRE